jgi:hypothetical protein
VQSPAIPFFRARRLGLPYAPREPFTSVTALGDTGKHHRKREQKPTCLIVGFC